MIDTEKLPIGKFMTLIGKSGVSPVWAEPWQINRIHLLHSD